MENDIQKVLKNLVEKLDLIDNDPSMQGIYSIAFVHGYRYTGPNYKEELDAARALLKNVKLYRHKKRGTEYQKIGEALLQVSNEILTDGTVVVIYKGVDGSTYVRSKKKFEDGRFTQL